MNKEETKEYMKKWFKDHPENIKKSQKKYYKNNREKIINASRQWQLNNPEKIKLWKESNPEYMKEYQKNRRKIDPKFRIDRNMGNIFWWVLKGRRNGKRLISLVNYSAKDLKKHLEKQFTPEMNWDNYGNYWEVDHTIPKTAFHYIAIEDPNFIKCWGLNNLRPLFIDRNRKKYNKVLNPFQPSLAIY